MAVFNGRFRVESAQVPYTASHGVPGNGALAGGRHGASGIAQAKWTLDPNVPGQHVTAQLLGDGKAAAGKYASIHFSARLSLASRVGCDPSKCEVLAAQKVTNVQDALDALCALPRRDSGRT